MLIDPSVAQPADMCAETLAAKHPPVSTIRMIDDPVSGSDTHGAQRPPPTLGLGPPRVVAYPYNWLPIRGGGNDTRRLHGAIRRQSSERSRIEQARRNGGSVIDGVYRQACRSAGHQIGHQCLMRERPTAR